MLLVDDVARMDHFAEKTQNTEHLIDWHFLYNLAPPQKQP